MLDDYVSIRPIKFKCEINTKELPCGFTPHVTANLVKELDRPYLFIEGKNVAEGKTFVRQTLDFCMIGKNPGLNIFVRLFYNTMKNFMNFELECPFKVAIYEVKHVPFTPNFDLLLNFFPPYMLQHLKVSIRRKVARKIQDVFVFHTQFMVVETDR